MAMLAAAMFVALFTFGEQGFGWSDPDSVVRLSLAASFVFGLVAGYRARD